MRLALVILIPLLFISCATRKERAIRHLNKAIALDSTVLKSVTVPVIIDTTIIIQGQAIIDTTIVVPETKTGNQVPASRLKEALDSVNVLNKKVTLLENQHLKISLEKTKEGLVDIQATIKPIFVPYKDTIPYIDTIPYYQKLNVPTVAPVTEVVYKKGYFYNVGVALHYLLGIAGVIAVIYYVFRKRNS